MTAAWKTPDTRRARRERFAAEARAEEERRANNPTEQEQLLDRLSELRDRNLSPELEELSRIVEALVEKLP